MKFTFANALIVISAMVFTGAEDVAAENPKILLDTSKGEVVLELYPDKAPDTVKNFLNYVDTEFFNGTIFHRVIPNFMIQGGGFTDDMKQKPTQAPIKNEADTGVKNDRGTIAMARTGDPHSATGQFFINTVDNDFLNHKNKTPQGWGYAAFGKVIKGMDTVDAISAVKTSNRGSYQDVPVEAVVIKSAKRLK
jgi:cyclophilin family peptidyl-prolyl cis-trans isomerase